jgi:hypothetical protein
MQQLQQLSESLPRFSSAGAIAASGRRCWAPPRATAPSAPRPSQEAAAGGGRAGCCRWCGPIPLLQMVRSDGASAATDAAAAAADAAEAAADASAHPRAAVPCAPICERRAPQPLVRSSSSSILVIQQQHTDRIMHTLPPRFCIDGIA